MRIACRIGIQSNATLANCSPFEAEMRRRLWWALKLIDSRIGELADSKTVALDPIWDCKIPLNVNDADLRTDMKEPPSIQSPTSDAIFVVVRSALGDFIRHAKFHLDFTNPSLKSVSKESKKGLIPENWNMVSFEKFIEDKYLESCNLDSPLHLMTLWTTRIQLAKCHMLEHYWRYSDSPETQQDTQRDTMLHHALTILHCDANIMSSPLTRGYGWLLRFYFPFPAYVHVLQDLQRRPDCLQADKAWEVLSNHFEVRVNVPEGRNSPFFDLFTKIVLSAWEKREALFDSNQKAASAPSIVSIIKNREKERSQENRSTGDAQQPDSSYMNVDSLPTVAPVGIDDIPYSLGGHYFQPAVTFGMQPQYQIGMSTDRNPFPALDWTFGGATVW